MISQKAGGASVALLQNVRNSGVFDRYQRSLWSSVLDCKFQHTTNVWRCPPGPARPTLSATSSWRAESSWSREMKTFMGNGNGNAKGAEAGEDKGGKKSGKRGEERGEEKAERRGEILESRKSHTPNVVDSEQPKHLARPPPSSTKAESKDDGNRLPQWLDHWSEEFKPESYADYRQKKIESTNRIVRIATDRVFDPSAVALLGMSASVVLGLGAVEGTLACNEIPFFESYDSGLFVIRYAFEQLIPSCVWETQNAALVASAMGYDPDTLLQSLDPEVPADARTLLQLCVLKSMRAVAAGFMLLAQVVRIGTIGAAAPAVLEERVKAGWEPPILGFSCGPGLVIRLCGRDSNVTSTSLRRMGRRLFPVFEAPHNSLAPMLARHSEGGRVPVFWSIRANRYGHRQSWKDFPVSSECLVKTSTGRKVLVLEADATNADDPLALGAKALDLTIDDASQGFRRIHDVFQAGCSAAPTASVPNKSLVRTLRVYLGNSMEVFRSGGGYTYTLRHRVRYAKEVDVLIDSRAPVLSEILRWCERATAAQKGGRKIVLFQTSSREYFLNLQLLMAKYGYEIHDPLDWRLLTELKGSGAKEGEWRGGPKGASTESAHGGAGKGKGGEDGGAGKGKGGEDGGAGKGKGGEGEGAGKGKGWEGAAGETGKGTEGRAVGKPMKVTPPPQEVEVLSFHARRRGGMMQILMDDKQWDYGSPVSKAGGVQSGAASTKPAEQEPHVHMSTLVDQLPRLIYYERSAETVNAVQALVNAGEVEAANSCALLDKQESAQILREQNVQVLNNLASKAAPAQPAHERSPELGDKGKDKDKDKDKDKGKEAAQGAGSARAEAPRSAPAESVKPVPTDGSAGPDAEQLSRGLHIVCSSEIYDDLFRQVRQWTRMGYPAAEIQRELDRRFKHILKQSLEVRETVAEVTKKDEKSAPEEGGEKQSAAEPVHDVDDDDDGDSPVELDAKKT